MEHVAITGANRGIGLALAAGFAAAGARVYAFCRRPAEAAELQTLAQVDSHLSIHRLDVRDDASIASAAIELGRHTPTLDVLIHNAGINNQPGTRGLESLQRQPLVDMIDNNAVSALLLTQALLPLLRASTRPRVVMVSSQIGSMQWADPARGYRGYGYAMSKAAMNMAARILASEMGSSGLISITMHPGWVQTDMGGSSAEITPQESAEGIRRVVDALTQGDNGAFYKWNGERHEW